MIRAGFIVALCAFAGCTWSKPGFAASNWSSAAYIGAGSIQQPSSQYFLLAYSAAVSLEYRPAKAGISFVAIGRPVYSSSGYTDQDYGGFAELQKVVAERGKFALGAGFGFGQMRGYVKSTDENGGRSDFRMNGPAATIDLRYATKKDRSFTARLSHTILPGLSTAAQTKAWVAWPWSVVMLGIGYRT